MAAIATKLIPLQVEIDPQGLVIGPERVGIDPARADLSGDRSRDETEIDPLAGPNRCAIILAMTTRDPRIDETGEPMEAAESRRRRADDPVILGRGPLKIEIRPSAWLRPT